MATSLSGLPNIPWSAPALESGYMMATLEFDFVKCLPSRSHLFSISSFPGFLAVRKLYNIKTTQKTALSIT